MAGRDSPVILCCTGSLDGGGSERQMTQLVTRVDRRAFHPELFLLYRRGVFLEQIPEDVSIHAFWNAQRESRRWLPGEIHRHQVRELVDILSRRRISLLYDRTYHMSLITYPAASRSKVPRISTIVSPPSRDFAGGRERFKWIKKKLLRSAYATAAVTIAVSDNVARDAATFYRLPVETIRVIPSPVDFQLVNSAAAESDSIGKHQDPGVFRILVVGRLSAEKGHLFMLEVVRELRRLANEASDGPAKIQVDILGDGPLRSECELTAQRLGISDCVSFHGFVVNPYTWMSSAHCLCIPSIYEGLPNVALEAMCLKTPVVATECSSGLRQLLGDQSRGVIVPIGDVKAFAQQVLKCYTHGEQCRKRTKDAFDYIMAHHNLDAWLETMQQCFREAIGKTGHGGSRI
ncbi:MAG: glycosyltransferase [Planctomycetales bacterium]|nr:glycosyltransferase [Planctomycetales bacterium]